MLAIGLPHGGPGQDEDSLNREDNEHCDDGPTNTLELIYERLKHGDEVAAHAAMSIARCLQEMVHQSTRGNKRGLEHWYNECCQLIAHLDGDDGDGENEEDDNNG
jgi:hypothetical protein